MIFLNLCLHACLCEFLSIMCMQGAHGGQQKVSDLFGTRTLGNCELSHGSWEPSPGDSQEQELLL